MFSNRRDAEAYAAGEARDYRGMGLDVSGSAKSGFYRVHAETEHGADYHIEIWPLTGQDAKEALEEADWW